MRRKGRCFKMNLSRRADVRPNMARQETKMGGHVGTQKHLYLHHLQPICQSNRYQPTHSPSTGACISSAGRLSIVVRAPAPRRSPRARWYTGMGETGSMGLCQEPAERSMRTRSVYVKHNLRMYSQRIETTYKPCPGVHAPMPI